MNVRDPFNLHRSPAFDILRGTARQAASSVTHRVLEAGAQAYESSKQAVEEMATFSIPKNVPSFTNPQRDLENRVWGASGITARSSTSTNGGVINGVQDRVGNFFEKNRDLPMYKDKPYSYASSRRPTALYKRKRVQAVFVVFVVFVLYLFGAFGNSGTNKSKYSLTLLQRPEDTANGVDWLDRRERVKEAFILSWDAYERYAWGMSLNLLSGESP